jgi:hypothetical protein
VLVEGGHSPLAGEIRTWKDENTLYVATDFGEGTLTPATRAS